MIKDKNFIELQQVFLSPIMDQLTGFGKATSIEMLQHLFRSYRAIEEIYFEENTVNMMGSYDPAEPLARLINQL